MGLGVFLVALYVILEILINGVSALRSSIIADPIIPFTLFLVTSLFFAVGYLLRLLVPNQAVAQMVTDYYEHVLGDTNQSVSIIDREYRIKFQNGAATNIFGNAVGGICYAVYFGRDSPCEDCMLRDVIDRYKRFTSLRELQDGRRFEVILTPFVTRDGSIVAVEMIKDKIEEEVDDNVLKKDRDYLDELVRERTAELAIANEELKKEIAERKQIEEKAAEREKELRVIAESSLDVIFVLSKTGKILYISPSAKELFGYEADEIIGTSFTKYVPKGELPRYWKTLKNEVLRDKKVRSFRTYVKHRDGHLTPVEITGQLVRREGKLVAQGTVRDITERMQYEEELKKHRDHLDELVRERTAELAIANEQLKNEIAERKQIEKKMIEKEKELRVIAESSLDVIFVLSKTGKFLYISPSAKELFGYEADEMIGTSFTKYVPKGELPRYWKTLKSEVLRDKKVRSFRTYVKHRDGHLTPVEITGQLVRREGKIVAQGTTRDITERMQYEEELKKHRDHLDELVRERTAQLTAANEQLQASESEIKAIIENVNDIIFQLSPTGYIQYVSPNVEKLYGWKLEDLIGKYLTKTTPLNDVPRVLGVLKRVLSGEVVKNFELHQKNAHGELVPMEVNLSPVKKDGRITGMQGVMRDITERKEAELLYRTIIDAASLAKEGFALVQDVDGIEGRHVFVNDYYCELTGYTKEELYQMSCHAMIHPSVRDEVVERYRRKMAGEKLPSYHEFEWIKKNGEVITVGLSSAVTNFKGKPAFLYYFRDITEEKKLKEEIKRGRAFLTSVLSSMNDMVAIMDVHGNIMRINHAAEEKLGFMNEDVTGLKFNEVGWFDGHLRDEIEPYFGEVAAGKNIEGHEITLTTADGRSIPSLFSMSPIVDRSSSEVLGLVAQVIDISELKKFSNELLHQKEELVKMTTELESSKAYLETLIDTIPSALFTIDTEQNITLWNRAAEEITGYKKDEMLGKNCRIIGSADCSEICTFLDVTAPKPVTGKECTIRSRNGNMITISTNVNNLRDLSGNIIGVIVSFIDITEKKEAARIIEASEAKFRTLVENLHAGVFRSTVEGEYIEANPAMTKILKSLTKSELTRSNVLDLLFTGEAREEICSRLRKEGEITGYEVPIETIDGGEKRWISVSMRCVNGRDAQYIDGVVEDVTRQKHYAEELEHEIEMATCELKNDKMELSKAFNELKELDELKTQFFSNISHELKTPLTVIKAHLHFLKTGKLGKLTEKMAKSVDVAAREAVDLEDLVETILDLARLDSGTFKLNLLETAISDVAADLVDRMRKKAEEEGQNLVLEVDGEIPKRLIDPKRMKQVLMNLVSNSIKYNPEGTTTTIKIYTDSKNIIIDVTDDGVGIEKKDLEKIFDRFYQVDGSTTRSGSGTGIGLSIVKELVTLHGGEITVESEVGAGSTFSVLLPIDWKA